MSARRFLIVVALIGVVAAGLRFWHLASIRGTALYDFDRVWVTSDMHSNRAWAERIAAGDWLDRDGYRPHFDWMDNVADPPTWRRWLGPSTYYQPPLYTYLLALFVRATGTPDFFRWVQALLGAVNVVLISLLARRVAGNAAGLIAGIIAAAYAPFILYDSELLRGTLVITFDTLVLLALHVAGAKREGGDPAGFRRSWILAGAALGGSYLADSAIVTFLPLALLWAAFPAADDIEQGRAPSRGTARAWRFSLARPGWLALGLLIAIAPLLLRNAIVGAPLLSTTTRAPLAFVMGNAPDARPVGAAIPDSTVEILRASDYGIWSTIRETIGAHGGHIGALLSLQWQKLAGLFNSYEVPDNPSFYYAALHSTVLRWTLRFSCVVGLGLVGLVLAARRPRENLLLYLFLAGFLALFLFAHVVSRYRQPLVILLAVFSGVALVAAARAARDRRWMVAAGVIAGSILLSFALPRTPPPGYRFYRPAEFLVASAKWEDDGDVNRAAAEIRQGLTLAEKENATAEERIALGLALGELYQRHERRPEALAALRDVLEEDPRNAAALAASGAVEHDSNHPMEALDLLIRAAQADPANTEVQARLGHLYWVIFKDGEKALPHIRKALDLAPTSPAAAGLSAMAAEIAARTGLTP